jgi:DNA (cytosine-5)-methyltransferase 1
LSRGEPVDVLFGGPPCQGFSLIGKRDMNDPRNNLVFQFMRMVREIRPRYFVMENVSGLTVGCAKGILERLMAGINDFGYGAVLPPRVLDAKDYGVPQSRKRLFLLGYRKDQRPPEYPAVSTHAVSARDAIYDLPNIDDFDELLTSDCLNYGLNPTSKYAKTLHGQILDRDDFSHPRNWDPRVLTGCLRTRHTEVSVKRFSETRPGTTEPVSRFFKLDPDGPCNTLRAGTDKSRGAYTGPRPIHPRDNRCVSVREAQRLHSFPDWFRVHYTKWHGFREVGNSVPPLLARRIAAMIVKALDSRVTKPNGLIDLGDPATIYFNETQASSYLSRKRQNKPQNP